MKLSDKEKAHLREAFKAMTPAQKLDHLWTYYKWPFLLAVTAIAVSVSFAWRVMTAKDIVLYTAYLNTTVGSQLDEKLSGGYLDWSQADKKTSDIYVYRGLYLSEDASVITHEAAYASRVKLLASIENHQLDVVIMSKEAYDLLSGSGYLLPLDQENGLDERVVSCLCANEVVLDDNSTEYRLGEADHYEYTSETVVNGVNLSSSALFTGAGFDGEVYAGIIANTPRKEESLRYLNYLFQAN